MLVNSYAVKNAKDKLAPFSFNRRALTKEDVLIKILYCGVCHSDIHQARDEWGMAQFPMVPGHEIVGKVLQVGANVKKFKVNDTVGVGCFVDSCRTCASCQAQEEQFCEKHVAFTYNSTEMDLVTPTYGGYSSHIVVKESYVLAIPSTLSLSHAAPLLCAGITTYSPLKQFKVSKGQKVGVIGLGGLGHMAVKFASSMGANVTVFSTSVNKEKDAKRLGAADFVVTKNPQTLSILENQFDFILDAVSAPHDLNMYLSLLKRGGALVLVGVPEKALPLQAFGLIKNRRVIAGSLIGGIKETQEMLHYCAEKNIVADVEIIPVQKINESFERTVKGDVHYRFVIDMSTL